MRATKLRLAAAGVTTNGMSRKSVASLLGLRRVPQAATVLILLVLATCGGPTDVGSEDEESEGPRLPLIRLNPFRTLASSSDLTIEVDGLDFTTGSTVHWNGDPLATTFVSSTKLSAVMSAANLASAAVVDVTVVAEPGQATNPLPFFVDATDVQPRFAYAGGGGRDGIVSGYRVDNETGALNPIAGSTVELDGPPRGLVAGPGGRFLYVSTASLIVRQGGSNLDISQFSIDRTTGILAPTGSVLSDLGSFTLDPAGLFLFARVGEEILVYSIDATTGNISVAPTSRVEARGNGGLAVESSGRFLYDANTNRGSTRAGVHAFLINRGTGELAYVGFRGTDSAAPLRAASDRCGKRLFVPTQASLNNGSFLVFNIDQLAGTLSGPVVSRFLTHPGDFDINPTCRSLYFASQGALTAVAVDTTTGAFGALNSFTQQGSDFGAVRVDPSGRFVSLLSVAPGMRRFALDPVTGALDLDTATMMEGNFSMIAVVP